LIKPYFGSLFLLSRAARSGDKTAEPDEVARVMKILDRLGLDTANKWSAGESWIPTICLPFNKSEVQSRQIGGRRRIEARSGPIPFPS